jgi:type I restriction enzyme S subunit
MENGKGTHAVGLVNGIGFGTTEFHVLRAKANGNDRFIYHWLQSDVLRLKAAALMTGSAGQQRVNPNFFDLYYIPFFPRSEQQIIANILDTLDTQIQQTEALIAKLKQMRVGLLHDLLTRGIDENGEVRDPVAHPEEFRETLNGKLRIPAQWNIYPLEKVAKISSGVTLGRNLIGDNTVELPYLRVANVQDGYLDLKEMKTIRVPKHEVDRFLLKLGDVLMTEGGDFDKLGRGTIWTGEIPQCLHQNHIFKVRTDGRYLHPEFLALISRSSYGKHFFLLSSKQSTNLASINSTQLKAFPIPCPTREEQGRIINILNAQYIQISTEEANLAKLKQLKKGLMNDLLTGRVRVTELITNDERVNISAHRQL